MKEVSHPRMRYMVPIRLAVLCMPVLIFAGIFIAWTLDLPDWARVLLGITAVIIPFALMVIVMVNLEDKLRVEQGRVYKLPVIDWNEVSIIKRLDIQCTVHTIRGMPRVEFDDFSDAALFKLARPPKPKLFQ